jgi:hypothetical protein
VTTTLFPSTPAPPPAPWPVRWTCAEFHRVGDLGMFEGRRAMLIGGVILEQGPMNPPHAVTLGLVEAAMRAALAVRGGCGSNYRLFSAKTPIPSQTSPSFPATHAIMRFGCSSFGPASSIIGWSKSTAGSCSFIGNPKAATMSANSSSGPGTRSRLWRRPRRACASRNCSCDTSVNQRLGIELASCKDHHRHVVELQDCNARS